MRPKRSARSRRCSTGAGVRAATGAGAAVAATTAGVRAATGGGVGEVQAVAAIVRGAAAGGGADPLLQAERVGAGHLVAGFFRWCAAQTRYEAARVSSRNAAAMKRARDSCIATPRGWNTCRSRKKPVS